MTEAEMLRRTVQLTPTVTPEVVKAYAELVLKDDRGQPIRPADHHELWLQMICDERIKKLLIIAPPESAKTTWVISAYMAVKLGKFPDRSFVIAGVTETVAQKRSASIRAITESKEWLSLFPRVKRVTTMKWDPVEWSLGVDGQPAYGRLHPTMAAYGTGGSITGSRADEIVADDLLDFDNTRTAYQRQTVHEWFHNSLLTRRKSRVGRVIVIGTAWHQSDLYQAIKDEGDWVICHTPLLSDTEQVYATITYPKSWSYEMLGEEKLGATNDEAE